MTDYFFRSAPGICNWLMSSACEDRGFALMRQYYHGLQTGNNALGTSGKVLLAADDAAHLDDVVQRAEHYARLSALLPEVLADRTKRVPVLHPDLFERATLQRLAGIREHNGVCLASILEHTDALKTCMQTTSKQLQWMELMRKHKVLPLGDPDRAEFSKLKGQFEAGYASEPPVDAAIFHLREIGEAVRSLHAENKENSITHAFGQDAELANECHHYTQTTLLPDILSKLGRSLEALEELETRYDQAMQSVRKPHAKTKPGTQVDSASSTIVRLFPDPATRDTGRAG